MFKTHTNPTSPSILALHEDLPRGVEGRLRSKSWMPRTYFATPEEIQRSTFKDKSQHIFLGTIDGETQAYKRFDGRSEYRSRGGILIGMTDDRHLLTCAGSRSGKGRACIIPNLLSYGGSCLVVDCKGENADVTASWRAEHLGHKVAILDPFSITNERLSSHRMSFNSLTFLTLDNPTIVEDAGLIADALIVSDSKDPHWSETARDFIEGVILHVVTDHRFHDEERTLPTVADLIVGKRMELDELLGEMMQNSSLENHVVAAARTMAEKPSTEQGSVISTARRNLRFLQYQSIRSVCDRHDFDLEDLKRDKLTVYLCLPATRMSTCAQWLRLFVNLTLGAMERVSAPPSIPVLMLLDEFPVLGYLKELETAAGQIAGLGVKLWPVVQDLGQLKTLYKNRWETFLGNSGVLQFFGNSEATTLDWISKRLGQTCVTTTTQGSLGHEQRNRQGQTGMSSQQQSTNLLSPEEISRYFGRNDHLCRQLIIIPGERPYILQRAYYDVHEAFAGRFQQWEGKR